MPSDLQIYRAVMKTDLQAFLEGAFPVVDNRWGLEVAPYLEYLISELTGVVGAGTSHHQPAAAPPEVRSDVNRVRRLASGRDRNSASP